MPYLEDGETWSDFEGLGHCHSEVRGYQYGRSHHGGEQVTGPIFSYFLSFLYALSSRLRPGHRKFGSYKLPTWAKHPLTHPFNGVVITAKVGKGS